MEPIIYMLPKSNKIIESNELNFIFSNHPNPKLMKYGFNYICESLDMIKITSNPYYRVGLKFDLERKDNNSISTKVATFFQTKKFNIIFAEYWEILNLFHLLFSEQNIYTTDHDTITEIVRIYQQLTKRKDKITILGEKNKKNATLIVYRFSEIDIDENAAVQFIINALPDLLSIQSKGGNMVLQFFGMQTYISTEIIYYLSSIYNESYIIKPAITSDLSENKYLTFLGLKESIKLIIPKHPVNSYLLTLGLHDIPNEIEIIIQCVNADFIINKHKRYCTIMNYLNKNVYEGATYQEMIKKQDENTNKWLELFSNISPENMINLLNKLINIFSNKCLEIRANLSKML